MWLSGKLCHCHVWQPCQKKNTGLDLYFSSSHLAISLLTWLWPLIYEGYHVIKRGLGMIMNCIYTAHTIFVCTTGLTMGKWNPMSPWGVMYADAVNAVLLCHQLWAFGWGGLENWMLECEHCLRTLNVDLTLSCLVSHVQKSNLYLTWQKKVFSSLAIFFQNQQISTSRAIEISCGNILSHIYTGQALTDLLNFVK